MKKTLRRISIYLLTGGASLYLGLLSLGGMYALVPLVPLAVLSFVLSVAYEGEIYLQNLTQAVKKLMKSDSLERAATKAYLKQLFDAHPRLFTSTRDSAAEYPSFFYDYLELLQGAHHDRRQKKRLKDLEKMFAEMVFGEGEKSSRVYQKELLDWLNKQEEELQPKVWTEYKGKQAILQWAIALPLSILAGLFSALGTTFLLFETISIVPVLAALSLNVWFVVVVPIALLAGVAYGLLTYNCTTDFMMNNPFSNWYGKIKRMWNENQASEAIVMGVAFSALCGLAGALTICTAGTWLTIVDENSSIYGFITALPKWVMGVANPIVITLSSLAFNLQNTSASLGLFKSFFMAPLVAIYTLFEGIGKQVKAAWTRESWLQFVNPFRFLYQILFQPLRLVLFLGHLISIGVTADRVPGFSKLFSAFLGFLAELGEDTHYFFGHECGGSGHSIEETLESHLEGDGHNHNLDLPTRFLEISLAPLELLRRGWNGCANWLVTPPKMAEDYHHTPCCHGDDHHHENAVPAVATTSRAKPSYSWDVQHPIWFMKHYCKKNPTLSEPAVSAFATLSRGIEQASGEAHSPEDWQALLHEKRAERENALPVDFKQKFDVRFG